MSNPASILARFPWLASSPRSSKTITWPLDLVAQVKPSRSKGTTSVLDDRIAYIAPAKVGDETWVFYADLKDDGSESVACKRVAVLPMRVDLIALLPRNEESETTSAEFATLQAETSSASFTFRIHTKDGAVIREKRLDAKSVYTPLVVGPSDSPRIAVCTWSGQPAPEACGGSPSPAFRLGYRPGYPTVQDQQHSNMFGDTIAVWDWEQDVVESFDLREKAKPHNSSFDFLPSNHIAVAAMSPGELGSISPELQVRHRDSLLNSFLELYPTDESSVQTEIVQRGSSRHSDMTTHYHHNRGYLSVLPHSLLLASDLKPTSRDPPGIVETRNQAAHVRTLKGACYLASQVGNRIVITRNVEEEEDEDEDEEEDEGDEDEAPEEPNLPRQYIVDFDPEHVSSLLALSEQDRTALSHALVNAEESTPASSKCREPLVEVITRHYDFDIHDGDEENDLEYRPKDAPSEWRAHLLERQRAQKRARSRSHAEPPGLKYDERPQGKREDVKTVGSACVRIRLVLPDDVRQKAGLALTDSGVLSVPKFGAEGRMFYYPL